MNHVNYQRLHTFLSLLYPYKHTCMCHKHLHRPTWYAQQFENWHSYTHTKSHACNWFKYKILEPTVHVSVTQTDAAWDDSKCTSKCQRLMLSCGELTDKTRRWDVLCPQSTGLRAF